MSTESTPEVINRKSSELACKLQRTPEEYLQDRVQYKINQYTKKAKRYRRFYWGLASVTIIGSVLVPALINLNVHNYVPTIVSLLVAVVVGVEGIFHTREHWRNYDLISSFLREEEMRFSTKTEPYSTSGQENENNQVFNKFVERVENAIAKERAETVEMRTSKPESIGTSGQ